MRIFIGLMLIGLLLFGCATEQQESVAPKTIGENETGLPEPVQENETEEEAEAKDDVPGILEVPDSDEIIEDKKDGPPARDQNDCSTLSPNCETCVAQLGCGWCKSRNGCFFGDALGPAPGIADCPPADWAYDEQACQGSKGGITCEENWNCADCLSGSGCMWCIEGSRCASEGTSEECNVGGWLKESFQCNYASR